MIEELDTVALTSDIEKYKLLRGDVGTVVHIYPDRGAYEVEFISARGDTIAVLTLLPGDLRTVWC